MKKIWILQLTLLLTLVLIADCRMRVTPSEIDPESAENADQETICGVITHINGNELELELLSTGGTTGAPGGIAAGEQSASGELEAGESSSSLTAVSSTLKLYRAPPAAASTSNTRTTIDFLNMGIKKPPLHNTQVDIFCKRRLFPL